MCCYNKEYVRRRVKGMADRKGVVTLWKVVGSTGNAIVANLAYKPGVNRAIGLDGTGHYNRCAPRGIHTYLSKRAARSHAPVDVLNRRVLAVECRVKDMIAAGPPAPGRRGDYQAVFTKVRIRVAAWRAAGLFEPKKGV